MRMSVDETSAAEKDDLAILIDDRTVTVLSPTPFAARNVEPSADAARGFVEIVVADDGEGMIEEVLSQAFTPYFTTKAAGSGTGLGLAQVRRFAEGRGGAVCIESERGGGTLVRSSSRARTQLGSPAVSSARRFLEVRRGLVVDEVLLRAVVLVQQELVRALHGLVGDEVAVARLAPALGYELPQDGLDFVFVLVLRDAARNDNVAHVSAFARAT